jgi:hypothetical protein
VWMDYAAHTHSTETLTRFLTRVAHHQMGIAFPKFATACATPPTT